ncbi:kinase-like protein [Rhizophagus irregularis]|uniref:Kinase-like protein n=4 Tax=Rhizophagus irregularis TaxID=588596 RepID=A0A2N0QC08_9GLOM|nr:kinase-like domain-containing protein [Rhizophagus irregularis DAOM 181602=DAOM 197198]EXX60887.1 Gin4p [Rhizophagus irregularis DAOM 197198w]PKC16557.1 kinase-like protein [Rhizophagus irregularis]POG82109.1 kinase-like domain-containing protein [Rhizophagus irregularis DAOM 181602=DAOM 197198]|eukprot:XP_025188975.1 kinase-like domain-containing protein [Rhizophagus irregularis DAOM 181602=DAOM 197198]
MSKVFLLIGLSVAMVSLWNVWNLYSSYSSKRTQEEKEKDKNTFTPKTNSQTNKITNKTAYSSYSSRRNSIIPISKSILTFEFIKEIGKGHYGKALLVRDKIFNKKFVLKEIPLEIYENHDLLKNEHIIHSILDNKFIVKYYGTIVFGNYIYLILEYAPQGDVLEYILNNGSLDEVAAAKIILQVLCGVDYMHQRNIVHRDLKPDNLLLFDKGLVKICDFGHCGVLTNDKEKLKGVGVGTPVYRSPELVLGLPHNEKTDIWSIGVLTYMFLTNESPFEDDDEFNITNRILKADYTLLDDGVSVEAKHFIYSCMQVNPMNRPSTQDLLNHPWILNCVYS